MDTKSERNPWQIWTYRLLLGNQPTKDNGLIQADSLHEKGDLRNALKSYEGLFKRRLSPLERASIGVRIASTYLSLQNAKSALSTIGTTYKNVPNGIDDVHPEAAIILGYAYAAQGDLDQSLRWFVQFEKLGGARGQHTSIANQGIRFVLRNASNSAVDSLPTAWSKQPLVSLWLGEERKLRARGVPPGQTVDIDVGPISTESSLAQQPVVGAKVRIGVILPLSGEHAVLGNSVKEGIELGVSANNPDNLIELIVRDVGSDAARIEEDISNLALNENVHFLIGPLLSNQAAAAAAAAKLRALPLITFSKSDSFSPGGGVYRLGTTSSSQVESLLDVMLSVVDMTRYAIVYPATSSGTEYADAFRSFLREHNIVPVLDRSYQPGQDSQLISIAEEIAASDAEGIFFPDSISVAARFFTNIPAPVRSRISPLGIAAWDESRQLKNMAGALEGAIFPTVFFNQAEDAATQQFLEAFQSKYGRSPDLLAAQGFDAVMLVIAAAQGAAREQTSLDRGLQTIGSYQGMTGNLSVLSSGEIQRKYKVLIYSQKKATDLLRNETAIEGLKRRRGIFKTSSPETEASMNEIRAY